MKYAVLFVVLWCAALQGAVAAPPLEAYGRLPGIEAAALSPSGKRYAMVASSGDERKLAVFEGSKALFTSSLGDIKVRDIEWVGDDRLLLGMSNTVDRPLDLLVSHEMYSLIDIDLARGTASSLFDKTQKVANAVFGDAGTVQIDGHYYKYFVGLAYSWNKARIRDGHGGYYFDGDHRNLYRVNLDTHEVSLEARGGEGPGFTWVVGNDGAVLAHSEYDKQKGIWRLYAGEDSTKLLLERKANDQGRIRLHAQGRRPNTVWVSDSTVSPMTVEEISVPDGKRETLFAEMAVDHLLYDPDSRLGIGAKIFGDPSATFFEPRWQARLAGTRKAFPDGRMRLVSYGRNLDRLIVRTEGGDDSGTYWLVDIASGAADPIGQEYPEVRAADVAPARWFSYKAGDGLELEAVLTLPRQAGATQKLPLVVLPHDGPDEYDVPGFDWWAQAFAASGYAVLQPNYRGSSGDLLTAGNGQWGRKMQSDLSDGVAALAAQGLVDPQRVCIAGQGYGGYAALAGVALQQGIYRCAVSVNGYSDLFAALQHQAKQYEYDSDSVRVFRLLTGADKAGDGSLRDISPVNFAERVAAPVLLLHGSDDVLVLPVQSKNMESALRKARKPVEYIELEREDHWLSRDTTRKAMVKASVEFVKKYNPPN